jgi:hypothetical protein
MRALAVLSLVACGPALRVDLATLQRRVDEACAPIRQVKIKARVRTDVAGTMAEVKRALDAGDAARADGLASKLGGECREEAERRRQLAPLVGLAEKRREVIPDEVWFHFLRLVADADYTNAIVCGESLAQGSPSGCDQAPARPRAKPEVIQRDPPPPRPEEPEE